jgi:hypothetical protein
MGMGRLSGNEATTAGERATVDARAGATACHSTHWREAESCWLPDLRVTSPQFETRRASNYHRQFRTDERVCWYLLPRISCHNKLLIFSFAVPPTQDTSISNPSIEAMSRLSVPIPANGNSTTSSCSCSNSGSTSTSSSSVYP